MSSATEKQLPHQNQGPVILGATLTVTIAALSTMITRLYVRLVMIRNCAVGQIIIIPEVYYGAGRHIQYIEPDHFATGYKLNFITQPIYLFAIALVKISVGFFLLLIAGPHTIKTLNYLNVSLNILTNVLFSIIIPIPLLWSVQMNKCQNATAAALVKTSFLPSYGRTGDWLWDSRNLTIWTVVECNTGIVAGNLPCLKPLFRVVLGSTYGRGSRKTTVPQYGYGTRQCGTGTRQSGAKGWGTLASNKTGDETDGPRAYGKAGESYMLTTINAERVFKAKSGTSRASGEERESTGKSSTDSLHRGHTIEGLGGIKVDTVVNVVESHSPLDFEFDDANPRERKDIV
ncbi:hypothetical protein EKO04_008005 [Ascochyta lentis]|uniref:Rhodopsin domain-containing protein n=1 Tax=Ascochyta lentis TaxID=205686 RepID=A0A8H7J135_9PLEO|nr:hypothetical protein EKO04_008005 [Ascochyta lentis]